MVFRRELFRFPYCPDHTLSFPVNFRGSTPCSKGISRSPAPVRSITNSDRIADQKRMQNRHPHSSQTCASSVWLITVSHFSAHSYGHFHMSKISPKLFPGTFQLPLSPVYIVPHLSPHKHLPNHKSLHSQEDLHEQLSKRKLFYSVVWKYHITPAAIPLLIQSFRGCLCFAESRIITQVVTHNC